MAIRKLYKKHSVFCPSPFVPTTPELKKEEKAMLKNAKKILCVIVVLIFTFNMFAVLAEEVSNKYEPFVIHMPYGLKLKYMLNSSNREEVAKYYDDMLVGNTEHRPVLNEKKELVSLEYDSAAYSDGKFTQDAKNLKILFDKELMLKHLSNCGLKDVISYKITVEYLCHDKREYVVLINTGNAIFFMPVLENGDTLGRFEHLTVYTPEEMKERLEKQPIEIMVMEEKLVSDESGYMEYGTYYAPLRAVCESLGYVVVWDGVNSRVNISKNNESFECILKPFDRFHYVLERYVKYPGLDELYQEPVGFCTIINGRIMITEFLYFLREIEPEIDIITSAGIIEIKGK